MVEVCKKMWILERIYLVENNKYNLSEAMAKLL